MWCDSGISRSERRVICGGGWVGKGGRWIGNGERGDGRDGVSVWEWGEVGTGMDLGGEKRGDGGRGGSEVRV